MIYTQFYITIPKKFGSTLPLKKTKNILKGIIRFHYSTTYPYSMTKTSAPGV